MTKPPLILVNKHSTALYAAIGTKYRIKEANCCKYGDTSACRCSTAFADFALACVRIHSHAFAYRRTSKLCQAMRNMPIKRQRQRQIQRQKQIYRQTQTRRQIQTVLSVGLVMSVGRWRTAFVFFASLTAENSSIALISPYQRYVSRGNKCFILTKLLCETPKSSGNADFFKKSEKSTCFFSEIELLY